MHRFVKFLVCLWHTLLRNDFASSISYKEFLELEEQNRKRKERNKVYKDIKSTIGDLIETTAISMRPVPSKDNLLCFSESVKVLIVHLNQIIVGRKSLDSNSYLMPLFKKCKTENQVKLTAEYYLKALNKSCWQNTILTHWCNTKQAVMVSEVTAEVHFLSVAAMEVYAKPVMDVGAYIDFPESYMKRISATGVPSGEEELFILCSSPLECHYTAQWYLTYNKFQEEAQKHSRNSLHKYHTCSLLTKYIPWPQE